MLDFMKSESQTITTIERSFRMLDAACQIIIPLAGGASITIRRQIRFGCGICNRFANLGRGVDLN
jgi:hypothetical protein